MITRQVFIELRDEIAGLRSELADLAHAAQDACENEPCFSKIENGLAAGRATATALVTINRIEQLFHALESEQTPKVQAPESEAAQ